MFVELLDDEQSFLNEWAPRDGSVKILVRKERLFLQSGAMSTDDALGE